jgi:hypothetical protein
MNCIIPFNKKICFDTPIAEITSISLEFETTINDDTILGNFIISGEYKTHEISANILPFSYNVPFDVLIPQGMDNSNLSFNINDFTYEINNDDLELKIEFEINGNEIIRTAKENVELKNLEDKKEEPIVETEEPIVENEEPLNEESTLINSINNSEDSFVTYHVHIIKTGETIDSLCSRYQETENNLSEYNDLSTFKVGGKLIIPVDD